MFPYCFYLSINPGFLIRHRPFGVLQAFGGGICNDAQYHKDGEDGVHQIKQTGLDVLNCDGYTEEGADGLDEDQDRWYQGKPEELVADDMKTGSAPSPCTRTVGWTAVRRSTSVTAGTGSATS